jgi:membrane protein DedA with SNARE-associated domain
VDPGIADGLAGPWMLAWLTVLVVLDGFIPPVPSEIALVAAGSFAVEGRVSAVVLVLLGTLGSLVSDLGVYALFRYRMADALDTTRWGRRAHGTIRRVVERFGASSTYGAIIGIRFLAGGRLTASATAGVGEVPVRRFAAAAGIGGFLWSLWHVALGYVTGRATGLPFWTSAVIGTGVGIAVGLVVAVAVAARHRRVRAQRSEPHNSEADPPADGPEEP